MSDNPIKKSHPTENDRQTKKSDPHQHADPIKADNQNKKIGIALSGGGIRATIFHLGVLKWMAEQDLLEQIERISSVSGGSLCIGLIYSHSGGRWPTSSEYINRVLPELTEVIMKKDIQAAALRRLILSPWYWNKKVNLMAKTLQKDWGVTGSLADLDKLPKWYANCTTFETGKRFRFSQENMGDYKLGYVQKPKIPVADAAASSAGFPVLIGPYKMKLGEYTWKKSGYSDQEMLYQGSSIHLWDGGVYDNLGLESVYKEEQGGSLSGGLNFLIVSNASGPIGYKKRKFGFSGRNLKRMLDIAMDQVGALRNRSVLDYITRTGNGMYINIGNSAEYITGKSGISKEIREELISQCLSSFDAKKVRDYSTTLSRPARKDYEMILRHGYETAKCTGLCYHSLSFT